MKLALVLDKTDASLAEAKAVLKSNGFDVVLTDSLAAAKLLLTLRHFDAVVVDVNIETTTGSKATDRGFAFARTVRETSPLTHVILWSNSSEHFGAAAAVGASYVTKSKYGTERLGEAVRAGRPGAKAADGGGRE